jgi:hypothetical protein
MIDNNNQPAFPDTMRAQPQSYINQFPERWPTGLTKIEYAATHIDVSKDMEDYGKAFFEELLGRPFPGNDGSAIDNYLFWAEAEAKLRVMKADALLKELSKA